MEITLSRFHNRNFELLEPYEGKLSCTVLRGEGSGKGADLPGLNEVNLGFITLDLIGNENAILISGFKAFGYATERYSPVLIDSACKTEPKYV